MKSTRPPASNWGLRRLWRLMPRDYKAGSIKRFLSRLKLTERGCWEWQGAKLSVGYGVIQYRGNKITTHRFCYQACNLDSIDGMEVHHTCENRLCVNPRHLLSVTKRDHRTIYSTSSIAYKNGKKTHCPKGHEYAEANTYINRARATPFRQCRTCLYERNKAHYLAKQEETPLSEAA